MEGGLLTEVAEGGLEVLGVKVWEVLQMYVMVQKVLQMEVMVLYVLV
jgi:hypothetical protein